MPKELPNFSRDVDRLIKTGRAGNAAEAEQKLAEQKRLIAEREAARKRVQELRTQVEPSEKELRAELERRLEVLEKAYERRKARLQKHYQDMIRAGVSPFHEQLHHESQRLSQIEQDYNRERGLFEQFDAEERLTALHEFGAAVASKNEGAIKTAKRKLEDVLDAQTNQEGGIILTYFPY